MPTDLYIPGTDSLTPTKAASVRTEQIRQDGAKRLPNGTAAWLRWPYMVEGKEAKYRCEVVSSKYDEGLKVWTYKLKGLPRLNDWRWAGDRVSARSTR